MTNANDPSHPILRHIINNPDWETEYGLTKRELIATMALQGLISKYNLKEPGDQITIAKMAIELADTFINELNK